MLDHICFDLLRLGVLLVNILWLAKLDQRTFSWVSSSDLWKIWSELLPLLWLLRHSAFLLEQHQHATFRFYNKEVDVCIQKSVDLLVN